MRPTLTRISLVNVGRIAFGTPRGDTGRAMSQENVEVVRASFDAWNAGDMGRWAGFLAPDVVWRQPAEWPERGPYVGRESVLRIAVQNRDAWDADTAEPIGDFIDAGDRVVVRFVWRGRGRGPEADMAVTCVYTVRSGRIREFEFFWNQAEALAAVGLSE
jgi:ketosteroid isomerase-like protein